MEFLKFFEPTTLRSIKRSAPPEKNLKMMIIIKFPIIKQKHVLIPLLYVNESKTFSASLEVSTGRIIGGLLIIPSDLITV